MNKKVYNAVAKRSKGRCEYCGRYGAVELHHILRRKVKETPDNCMMLCPWHHRGTKGVHGRDGRKLDLHFKKQLQKKYFDKGYNENKVRRLMGGKLY